jgi:hypothetical protein
MDPPHGRTLEGPAILDLLRALAYGEQPTTLVRRLTVR